MKRKLLHISHADVYTFFLAISHINLVHWQYNAIPRVKDSSSTNLFMIRSYDERLVQRPRDKWMSQNQNNQHW